LVLKGNLRLAGYEVITAETAQEALQSFRRHPVDLMILDLTLPDLDGLEICCHVREMDEEIPIIMLTARDSLTDKVMGFDCGADDYIVKPFEFLELKARIKTCLRRWEKRHEKVKTRLEEGPLVIDPVTREARFEGRPVHLTKREFDLLYYLVSHAGQVLSRDDIRHALWGKRRLYSWSRTIDVHIQHLRLKLEKDPKNPSFIQTVPGVGYRYWKEEKRRT
jgi:two-component system alkaline phosphatase synthesis response regulator PhoP/OmpR family response regulator RpaB